MLLLNLVIIDECYFFVLSCDKCCSIIFFPNERDRFGPFEYFKGAYRGWCKLEWLQEARYITSCLICDNNFLWQWSGNLSVQDGDLIWRRNIAAIYSTHNIIELRTPDHIFLVFLESQQTCLNNTIRRILVHISWWPWMNYDTPIMGIFQKETRFLSQHNFTQKHCMKVL